MCGKQSKQSIESFNIRNGFHPLEVHNDRPNRGLIITPSSELSNSKILKLLSSDETNENLPISTEKPVDYGQTLDLSDPDVRRKIDKLPLYGVRVSPAELTSALERALRNSIAPVGKTQADHSDGQEEASASAPKQGEQTSTPSGDA